MESTERKNIGATVTLPNALSATRLVLAPSIAWAIATGRPTVALGLFVVAATSDFIDGPLARRLGQVTRIGGLIDHGADATFVTAALAALAWRGDLTALLPIIVPIAFMQYVLDSRALAGQPLRGNWLGRVNGIAYFVLVGVPVVRDGIGLGWPPGAWVAASGWLLVATTLTSMSIRLVALVRHLRR